MKNSIARCLAIVCLFAVLSGCHEDPLAGNYSGTYCITARDHVLLIQQTGMIVHFVLTADTQTLTGSGSVAGNKMKLQATVEGKALTLALAFAADGKSFTGKFTLDGMESGYDGTSGVCADIYPAGDISLVAPYVHRADMASIHKGFGCSVTGPWEDHSGLDVVPAGNLKPFRAMASGKVVEINATRYSGNNNWMISVVVKYNNAYRVLYAFENLTPEDADRDIQLANLDVSTGQIIAQGDVLGRLHTVAGTYYHVHISLIKNGERICPEPYLTPDALEGLYHLIHVEYPDLQMCYACE